MPKHKLTFVIILLSLLLGMSACSSFRNGFRSQPKGGTGSLTELKNLRGVRPGQPTRRRGSHISAMRSEMLKEQALTIGAQAGLAWESKHIDAMLEKHIENLDLVFNFNAMLMEHNVLPPILVEGHHTMNLAGDDVIRLTDRTYQIKRQARFVSSVPNWRIYLMMLQYEQPAIPHKTLLPKNRRERRIWRKNVAIGWRRGIRQGTTIFEDNVARLTQAMKGMILYRTLLAQHMVSAPFVAKTEYGVTGDGTKMSVNDQVLRITAMPSLDIHSERWKAGLTARKPERRKEYMFHTTRNGHDYHQYSQQKLGS